jgi:hypothetical protein
VNQINNKKVHHLVATYKYDGERGSLYVYLDGGVLFSSVSPNKSVFSRPLLPSMAVGAIGNAPDGGEAFGGVLDEIAL